MKELLDLIVGMVGDKLPVAAIIRLAPVLAPVIADLTDGDAHLSQENRAKVLEALDGLKEGDIL